MRNRQPPAHYNPPPMFGLRTPEGWSPRTRYYLFTGKALYAYGRQGRQRKVIGTYDGAIVDGDTIGVSADGRAFLNGQQIIPPVSWRWDDPMQRGVSSSLTASDDFAQPWRGFDDDTEWSVVSTPAINFRDDDLQSTGPIHVVPYEPIIVPPPLTSGTDAEP